MNQRIEIVFEQKDGKLDIFMEGDIGNIKRLGYPPEKFTHAEFWSSQIYSIATSALKVSLTKAEEANA